MRETFFGDRRGPDWDRDWEGGRQDDQYGRYYEPRSFSGRDRYGDEHRRTPREETERLIASDKVEGTRVFDRDGRRVGEIENFMVDKRRGQVEYAVLSFGGFLGMGDRFYPLPWNELTYDEGLGGYKINLTQRDLERAPSHRAGTTPTYDKGYSADIWSYYGTF
jgi:sporulation protein YlmC with PRC-barrel domain